MNSFAEISISEMQGIDGGCTWCKVGGTLITIGGVLFTGVNAASVVWGIASLATIWIS